MRSTSTVRTYPVSQEEFRAAIEDAVRELPRWTLEHSSETEIRAVRESRLFGFGDDVTVRLQTLLPGGTRAELRSASRFGVWDLGQNGRNLRKLLEAIDRELNADVR